MSSMWNSLTGQGVNDTNTPPPNVDYSAANATGQQMQTGLQEGQSNLNAQMQEGANAVQANQSAGQQNLQGSIESGKNTLNQQNQQGQTAINNAMSQGAQNQNVGAGNLNAAANYQQGVLSGKQPSASEIAGQNASDRMQGQNMAAASSTRGGLGGGNALKNAMNANASGNAQIAGNTAAGMAAEKSSAASGLSGIGSAQQNAALGEQGLQQQGNLAEQGLQTSTGLQEQGLQQQGYLGQEGLSQQGNLAEQGLQQQGTLGQEGLQTGALMGEQGMQQQQALTPAEISMANRGQNLQANQQNINTGMGALGTVTSFAGGLAGMSDANAKTNIQAADADLSEPGGPAHWTLREEDNFLLAKNQKTGGLFKVAMEPLSHSERRQALAPHGAGGLGPNDPDRRRTVVSDGGHQTYHDAPGTLSLKEPIVISDKDDSDPTQGRGWWGSTESYPGKGAGSDMKSGEGIDSYIGRRVHDPKSHIESQQEFYGNGDKSGWAKDPESVSHSDDTLPAYGDNPNEQSNNGTGNTWEYANKGLAYGAANSPGSDQGGVQPSIKKWNHPGDGSTKKEEDKPKWNEKLGSALQNTGKSMMAARSDVDFTPQVYHFDSDYRRKNHIEAADLDTIGSNPFSQYMNAGSTGSDSGDSGASKGMGGLGSGLSKAFKHKGGMGSSGPSMGSGSDAAGGIGDAGGAGTDVGSIGAADLDFGSIGGSFSGGAGGSGSAVEKFMGSPAAHSGLQGAANANETGGVVQGSGEGSGMQGKANKAMDLVSGGKTNQSGTPSSKVTGGGDDPMGKSGRQDFLGMVNAMGQNPAAKHIGSMIPIFGQIAGGSGSGEFSSDMYSKDHIDAADMDMSGGSGGSPQDVRDFLHRGMAVSSDMHNKSHIEMADGDLVRLGEGSGGPYGGYNTYNIRKTVDEEASAKLEAERRAAEDQRMTDDYRQHQLAHDPGYISKQYGIPPEMQTEGRMVFSGGKPQRVGFETGDQGLRMPEAARVYRKQPQGPQIRTISTEPIEVEGATITAHGGKAGIQEAEPEDNYDEEPKAWDTHHSRHFVPDIIPGVKVNDQDRVHDEKIKEIERLPQEEQFAERKEPVYADMDMYSDVRKKAEVHSAGTPLNPKMWEEDKYGHGKSHYSGGMPDQRTEQLPGAPEAHTGPNELGAAAHHPGGAGMAVSPTAPAPHAVEQSKHPELGGNDEGTDQVLMSDKNKKTETKPAGTSDTGDKGGKEQAEAKRSDNTSGRKDGDTQHKPSKKDASSYGQDAKDNKSWDRDRYGAKNPQDAWGGAWYDKYFKKDADVSQGNEGYTGRVGGGNRLGADGGYGREAPDGGTYKNNYKHIEANDLHMANTAEAHRAPQTPATGGFSNRIVAPRLSPPAHHPSQMLNRIPGHPGVMMSDIHSKDHIEASDFDMAAPAMGGMQKGMPMGGQGQNTNAMPMQKPQQPMHFGMRPQQAQQQPMQQPAQQQMPQQGGTTQRPGGMSAAMMSDMYNKDHVEAADFDMHKPHMGGLGMAKGHMHPGLAHLIKRFG